MTGTRSPARCSSRRAPIASRFVSGYLIQLQPAAGATDGPDADSGALHAWAEVYLPGAGWLGLDPTSGMVAAEGHIPLAATGWPAAVAPVIGTAEPGDVQLDHAIRLSRLA